MNDRIHLGAIQSFMYSFFLDPQYFGDTRHQCCDK